MGRHAKKTGFVKALGLASLLGLILGGAFFALLPAGLHKPSGPPENPKVKEEVDSLLPGHWLRTRSDQVSQDIPEGRVNPSGTIPQPGPGPGSPGQKPEQQATGPELGPQKEPARRLNRNLDNLNIMYLWTDDGELKVLSVMTINRQTREAALVVIPRFVRIQAGGRTATIGELYREGDRATLAGYIEKAVDMQIPNYLNVDQQAVTKISNLVGPLSLKGETITILEAFEQTRDGKRTDDQDVVRAVALKILNPAILIKLPEILWIFAHDVKTNLGTQELLDIYRFSRESKVTEMRKIALPGEDFEKSGVKYRVVSEDTWKNVFYDLTK